MENSRILNILIPTRHLGESKLFYTEIMGFECVFESETSCYVRGGGVNIAIYPISDDPLWLSQGRGIALDVVVENLGEAEKDLQHYGVVILRKWQDANGKFLLVEDPDKNLLELIEPPAGNS